MIGRNGDVAAPRMDAADAFVRIERLLDRIRRGEIEATADDRDRLTAALDALRGLRHAA